MPRKGLTFRMALMVLLFCIGSSLARAEPMDRLSPIPFHVVSFGGAKIEISLSKDKGLVFINLQKGDPTGGVRAVLQNTVLPFTVLYLPYGDRIYLSFSDQLVIANLSNFYLMVIPHWTAADMYLWEGVLYADLAFDQPYGSGMNTLTYNRTGLYKKQRPFDVKAAIKAKRLE